MIDINTSDYKPESVLEWVAEKLYYAVGADGDGGDQMVWSAVLAIAAYMATPVGLFVTVFAGLFFSAMFLVGAGRLLWDHIGSGSMDLGVDVTKVTTYGIGAVTVLAIVYFGASIATAGSSIIVMAVAGLAVAYALYKAWCWLSNGRRVV